MTDGPLMDADCIHGVAWYECKVCGQGPTADLPTPPPDATIEMLRSAIDLFVDACNRKDARITELEAREAKVRELRPPRPLHHEDDPTATATWVGGYLAAVLDVRRLLDGET